MIRINLKRNQVEVEDKGKHLSAKVRLWSSYVIAFLQTYLTDFHGFVVLVVCCALAILPHLVFTQYRSVVTEQREFTIKKLEDSVKALNDEVQKFEQFRRELESYEKQKTYVKNRLEIVQGLLQKRDTPVNLLDALGQSLPMRTWITLLELNSVGKEPGIRITGMSLTNDEISDFMDKITQSIHFTEVKLEDVTTTKARDGRLEVRTFKMKALVKAFQESASAPSMTTPSGVPLTPLERRTELYE